MKLKLDKIVEKAKKSNLFITVSVVVILLSSLITIWSGVGLIVDSYNATVGYKSILLKKISCLSADTNVDYFKSLLGSSVYVNDLENEREEHIFVHPLYYVQAITEKNGRVIGFSVTTRESNFNPTLELGPWNLGEKQFTLVLGKTTFGQLDSIVHGEPERLFSFSGAHNFFYSEEYYFGNPGGYQSYAFSVNESGYNNADYPPIAIDSVSDFRDPELQEYRKLTAINTYKLTAPFTTTIDLGITSDMSGLILGPNYNQVRTLREGRGVENLPDELQSIYPQKVEQK